MDWLPYCIGSMLCLAVRSNIWSTVSAEVNHMVFLYFSPGYVLFALLYFIFKTIQNIRNGTGRCWVDQNLVKNGKLCKINILGFTIFQLLSFLIMNLGWITVWTTVLADLNAAVVTVIWSVTPLGVAITEYFFFGQRLKPNYKIGMVLIVICAVALSLSSWVKQSSDD